MRRHKYGAVKTLYNGRRYDSMFEAHVSKTLDARKAAGEITHIEYQRPYKLVVNGVLICQYIADFRITLPDGSQELVEAKGYPTEVWRLKEKLFRALFPELLLTVVTKDRV